MQEGDFILAINGEAVRTTDELHDLIYANLGQDVLLEYQRGNQVSEVSVVPRDPPPPEGGAIGIAMGYATQPTTIIKAVKLMRQERTQID